MMFSIGSPTANASVSYFNFCSRVADVRLLMNTASIASFSDIRYSGKYSRRSKNSSTFLLVINPDLIRSSRLLLRILLYISRHSLYSLAYLVCKSLPSLYDSSVNSPEVLMPLSFNALYRSAKTIVFISCSMTASDTPLAFIAFWIASYFLASAGILLFLSMTWWK